jgi:hypothetical protein
MGQDRDDAIGDHAVSQGGDFDRLVVLHPPQIGFWDIEAEPVAAGIEDLSDQESGIDALPDGAGQVDKDAIKRRNHASFDLPLMVHRLVEHGIGEQVARGIEVDGTDGFRSALGEILPAGMRSRLARSSFACERASPSSSSGVGESWAMTSPAFTDWLDWNGS